MTDRSTRAYETGDAGEAAVADLIKERGFSAIPGPPGEHDLLVQDIITVEVKTTNRTKRADGKYSVWQFCLYSHDDRQQPFKEDVLILRCRSTPPCHFIIPGILVNYKLTKIDITSKDPWRYVGRWASFREAWELIDLVVFSALYCKSCAGRDFEW